MKNTILLLTNLAHHLSAFANTTIALIDMLDKNGKISNPCHLMFLAGGGFWQQD